MPSLGPKRLVLVASVLACLVAPSSAGDANVYLFDMGGPKTPLWAGFARVTPKTSYNPKLGYGWAKGIKGLTAYTGEKLDALAIDCINSRLNLAVTFQVDAPNGDYVVWVLTGSMGNFWRLKYLRSPHELWLQGKRVRRIAHPDADLFRCADYDWSKGDDIFERFIASRFTWLRSKASVKSGKLVIRFRPSQSFPVCAVVVASSDVADRVQEKLDRIDAKRREAFYHFWRPSPAEADPPAPVSPEERRRGYVLATVHCSDDLQPRSQPAAGASRERVEFFATPGAQEQASFAVFGLRDLHEVSFEITDLRDGQGNVLPASLLEKGLVQFLPWKHDNQQFRLKECLILPLRPTFVGAGTCKRFWLTLRTPPRAKPGVYEGTIRVTAVDAPPATLRLRVRVIPVKLATPPVERYMYFGTLYFYGRAYVDPFDEKKFWDLMRTEVRFIKDNQFCRAECILPRTRTLTMKDGKITDVNLSDTEKLMRILREENAMPRDDRMICRTGILNGRLGGHFRHPAVTYIPSKEGRENYIRAIKIIDAKARKAGWPVIAFEMLGEFTNFGAAGEKFAIQVHSDLKKAGVHNTLRGNGPRDMAAIYKGLVDYPQPNWAMMQTKDFDFMKKTAKRLWAYNFTKTRFAMGWFCFKHGILRASFESGVYANGQPGNYFDKHTMFPMGLPISMKEIRPTVWLKRLVQGAVDYEYLCTLDARIREAEKSGRPEAVKRARAARAWLNAKLGELPNGVDYMRGDRRADRDVQGRFWPVHDLDKFRWRMARFIMDMNAALGRAGR